MKTVDCALLREDGQEFYTMDEACQLLSISRRSLGRYIEVAIVSDAGFKASWDWKNPRSKRRKITPYQLEILSEIKRKRNEHH